MSLLFAPLAWDLPQDDKTASSTDASTAESSSTPSWPASKPSAPSARWRINSGDLEEMMRVASGLDSATSRPASAPLLVENGGTTSPPLSPEDLVEERSGGSVIGFPISRGSSPLYGKQHQLQHHRREQQHQHDTTAPSSPCTPSLHMHSASGMLSAAVSPTSSRSEEAAFQQHVSLEFAAADSRAAAAAAAPPLSARISGGLAVAAHAGSSSNNNHGSSPSGARFGLKLLVSNSMAGTLIGKGGTRICEIKDECLADIKVTPNGRFYPGTHERVVLVVGEPGSVQMACDRIVTTIYTAADTSLDITQRVLIPDAASGLIIGHDGVRLGDLRQEAGVASIQVSPRDMCTVAGERVVTLQGPMSSVIHGLTLIVDRMMEDTSASRYQNMSTIYRAVHLHLPPFAVPGMHDNGASPRHVGHPRLSPSYGGPSPHSQHDYLSPVNAAAAAAAAAGRGGGREYGGGSSSVGGSPHWDIGGHGGGGGGSALRNMSMQALHDHVAAAGGGGGSPLDHHHRSHTAPAAVSGPSQHFGGRHFRHDVVGGGGGGGAPRDFDISEVDLNKGTTRGRAVDIDDCRIHDYDSISPADLGRPGSQDGYMHHSPRLPGPSPRDFDHMRQQQQQQQQLHGDGGGRGFSRGGGNNGGYLGSASQSEFSPLHHQRLRQQQQQQQQQQQHQEASAGMLLQDHRAVTAAAASQQQQQQQQKRNNLLDRPSSSSSLHRVASASLHVNGGNGNGLASPPPHSGALRPGAVGGSPHHGHHHHRYGHGDASGLSGMFESMSLNSPHGLAPSSMSSPGSVQQLGQGQGQGGGGGGASCIVHGELPVPDADVGIILGKGGSTVRELQQLSGAKIMIARRNEFMPGTKHRLVTIAGPPLAVNMARFLIMRKIQTEKEKL